MTDQEDPFNRLARTARPRQLRVLVDTTTDRLPSEAWQEWVVSPIHDLLLGLRDGVNGSGLDCATVIIRMRRPQADLLTGIAAAALEGLRGSVGSAALELGPAGLRTNLVVVSDGAEQADAENVLRYLEDPVGGGYTTGATLHVGARWSPLPVASTEMSPLPATGRVLITGAAGGLGFASASRLVEDGYDVILSDLPGPALATAATALSAPALPADVTDRAAVAQLARDVRAVGPLRAVAILHGVGTSGAISDLTEAVLDRSLQINAEAILHLLDEFESELGGTGGSIVVLSSQAGVHAEQFNSAYCAAKFAAVGLVAGAAAWLAARSVRIHAVCPGPIDTPLMRSAFATMADAAGLSAEEYLAQRLAGVPLRRTGTVEQLAASTALLISLQGTGMVLAPTGAAVLT